MKVQGCILLAWRGIALAAAISIGVRCGTFDGRYRDEITFELLDVTVALKGSNNVVRCDGPVDDMDEHQAKLLEELGLAGHQVSMPNAARFGRTISLPLEGGGRCAFIWVLDDPDALTVVSRLNHEKFHALYALQPTSIDALNAKAGAMGYIIDLGAHDEELAATMVEVLTAYAGGNDVVVGTGRVMEAVALLQRSHLSVRSD
jgi:hypothetical protein